MIVYALKQLHKARPLEAYEASAPEGTSPLPSHIVRLRRRLCERAYRECFLIVLIASLGPFQPKNVIFFSSRASVASKNFSSSLTARAGRCRMSCKSPSKGARSGSAKTRSLRLLFPCWFAGRKARLSVCIEAQGLDTSRHHV